MGFCSFPDGRIVRSVIAHESSISLVHLRRTCWVSLVSLRKPGKILVSVVVMVDIERTAAAYRYDQKSTSSDDSSPGVEVISLPTVPDNKRIMPPQVLCLP